MIFQQAGASLNTLAASPNIGRNASVLALD